MKTEDFKVQTAKDIIKHLQSLPEDTPIYFDCPHCGKANGFHKISIAGIIFTEIQKEQTFK